MAMTAQQVTQKWLAGVQGGTEAYKEGVRNVSVNPAEAAIAALPRYLDGVQRAVAEGRVEQGLRRVSLEDWKRRAMDKGANRLASGARASEGDYLSFMQEFLPYTERVKAQLPPRGGLEENLNRMMQNARMLSEFRRSK